MAPRRSPSVSVPACGAATRGSQRGREQPAQPPSPPTPTPGPDPGPGQLCCTHGPQDGVSRPQQGGFCKHESPVPLSTEIWGARVSRSDPGYFP